MKFIIDMNLSPKLVDLFEENGYTSLHWSFVGDPRATDYRILNWAKKNNHVVVTNDLDFGDILASTNAQCPSVIQIRTQDVTPNYILPILLQVFSEYKTHLVNGALVTVDEKRSRVRILPISQKTK
jgi:predicted nuclease of predicted toxin-antitoxin system